VHRGTTKPVPNRWPEERVDAASRRGISTRPVLFDDCWHPYPATGRQADAIPGIHNYRSLADLERQIRELKARGRPLLCTEWQARN
jgi:hypothetical protein